MHWDRVRREGDEGNGGRVQDIEGDGAGDEGGEGSRVTKKRVDDSACEERNAMVERRITRSRKRRMDDNLLREGSRGRARRPRNQ